MQNSKLMMIRGSTNDRRFCNFEVFFSAIIWLSCSQSFRSRGLVFKMKLLTIVCLLFMYLHASKGADSPQMEDASPTTSSNPSFPKYVSVDQKKLTEFSQSPKTRPLSLPKSRRMQNKDEANQTTWIFLCELMWSMDFDEWCVSFLILLMVYF